jgi:hypothetical protein
MAPFVASNDDAVIPVEEAFPIMQVVITSIIFAAMGIGLLVYFNKRHSSKSPGKNSISTDAHLGSVEGNPAGQRSNHGDIERAWLGGFL